MVPFVACHKDAFPTRQRAKSPAGWIKSSGLPQQAQFSRKSFQPYNRAFVGFAVDGQRSSFSQRAQQNLPLEPVR